MPIMCISSRNSRSFIVDGKKSIYDWFNINGAGHRTMTHPENDSIKLFAAVAARNEVRELIPRFAQASGLEVDVTFDLNPAVAKRIQAGESFDVGITNPWFVDALIQGGKVIAASHLAFGRAPLTIGARIADERPMLTSREEVCALLLRAQSIAYTGEGTSGKSFQEAIDRLGLRDQVLPKSRPLGAGQPVIAAASGEVELAIAPMTTIMAAPGIAPIATFPADLELDIDMSVFVSTGVRDKARAMQLVDFLTDPAIDDFLAAKGVMRYRLGSRSYDAMLKRSAA